MVGLKPLEYYSGITTGIVSAILLMSYVTDELGRSFDIGVAVILVLGISIISIFVGGLTYVSLGGEIESKNKKTDNWQED